MISSLAVFHQLRFWGQVHQNYLGDTVGTCASLKTYWIRTSGFEVKYTALEQVSRCVLVTLMLENHCPMEIWVLVSALAIHLDPSLT